MNKIKHLRTERGWNQDQLGEKLNVKRAAVSKYENEHIPLNAETICKLCNIFEVSADYIIGRTDTRQLSCDGISDKLQPLIGLCSDLNESELENVIAYIDFLKSKRTKN